MIGPEGFDAILVALLEFLFPQTSLRQLFSLQTQVLPKSILDASYPDPILYFLIDFPDQSGFIFLSTAQFLLSQIQIRILSQVRYV